MTKLKKEKLDRMVSDFVTQGIAETEGPAELMTVFLHCVFVAGVVGDIDAEEVAECISIYINDKKFIGAMNRITMEVTRKTVQ